MRKKLSLPIKHYALIHAAVIIIVVAVIYILGLIMDDTTDILNARINDMLFSMRYTITGKQPINPDIIYIELSDTDIDTLSLDHRDRSMYTRLINLLTRAGARSVLMDMVFRDTFDQSTDSALVRAVADNGAVYLPIVLALDYTHEDARSLQVVAEQDRVLSQYIIRPQSPGKNQFATGEMIISPFEAVMQIAKRGGHINCSPSLDGVHRRFPLLVRSRSDSAVYYPALALSLACDVLGIGENDMELTGTTLRLHRPDTDTSLVIPLDNQGNIVINWAGPRRDSYPRYSLGKIVAAQNNPVLFDALKPLIQDKIVIVSDVSTIAQDYGTDIFYNTVPLSSIHANITNSLLTGRFVHEAGFIHHMIGIIILFLLLYWVSLRGSSLTFLLSALGLYGAYAVYVGLAFMIGNRLSVLIQPSIAYCLVFVVLYGLRFLKEEHEKVELQVHHGLERAKRIFMNAVTHEFKTPLSLIAGNLEAFKKANTDTVLQDMDKLTMINHDTQRMRFLTDHFTELSHFDTDIVSLSIRRIELMFFIQRLITNFVLYLRRDIQIVFDPAGQERIVYGDPGKIEIIITRLLLHALMFTKPGGNISVTVDDAHPDHSPVTKGMTIMVRDPGIPLPEDQPRFVPDYTGSPSVRLHGSAGLNLMLLHEYVILHHGMFGIYNDEGGGVRTVVTLPTGRAHKTDGSSDADREFTVGDTVKRIMDTYTAGLPPERHTGEALDTQKTKKILIIDYDPGMRYFLRHNLEDQFHLSEAQDGNDGLALIPGAAPDLIICNYRLPDMKIEAFLQAVTTGIPVLLITTEPLRADLPDITGDFLMLPAGRFELTARVEKLLNITVTKHPGKTSPAPKAVTAPRDPDVFKRIITDSDSMRVLFTHIEKFAPSPRPVLITGETGVGKELFADVVHRLSCRHGQRTDTFIKVNIAGRNKELIYDDLFGHKKGAFSGATADKKGFVEEAGQGTLFLDEIGDLDLDAQVKLLRLLEYNEFIPLGENKVKKSHARIIAATNADLTARVRAGMFREDLYYRLMTHHIHIPPLRERPADIPLLIEHFIRKAAETLQKNAPRVPKKLCEILQTYYYPGNVRELEALLFDAVSRCDKNVLTIMFFREYLKKQGKPEVSSGARELTIDAGGETAVAISGGVIPLQELTDMYVLKIVAMTKTQRKAAELLGIPPYTLSRKLQEIRKRTGR